MDEGWFEPVRAYCERTDASFWAEPVNALSNGAFLIAAAAAAGMTRGRDPAALALAALVAVVGTGSFLFHTFANRWSLFADVIPIAAFIYVYFLLAIRRYFGLSLPAALAATLLFAGFNLGFPPSLDALTGRSLGALTNGSIHYVPAALALFGVGAGLLDRGRRETGWMILGIGALFLISLGFRTADTALCPIVPLGTHALWHGLNAAVLYGLIAAAVRFRDRDPASR